MFKIYFDNGNAGLSVNHITANAEEKRNELLASLNEIKHMQKANVSGDIRTVVNYEVLLDERLYDALLSLKETLNEIEFKGE